MLDAKFLGLDIKDIKPMFTNELIDEINDYDREKIIAAGEGSEDLRDKRCCNLSSPLPAGERSARSAG